MILLTDIGRDVDDAVALTYAIISGVPLKYIVTTSKDAVESANICQNIINILSEKYPSAKKIKVLSGSTKSRKDGKIPGNFYKGKLSKGNFSFDNFDKLHIKKSDAIVIGPHTDLLSLIENNMIKRVLFMGQAKKDGTSLDPDMEAYNFRCDPFASEAVFQFQEIVPFAFVGKNLAYKVPLTKEDFHRIADSGNPIGEFIRDHALESFELFKKENYEKYEKLYGGTNYIFYCYDPLTIMAVTNPELFIFEEFGKHRIGVALDGEKAKEKLISTISRGLP